MKPPSGPFRRLTGHDLAFALQRVFATTRGLSKQETANLHSVMHQVAGEALGKAIEAQGLVVVHKTDGSHAEKHPEEIVVFPEEP